MILEMPSPSPLLNRPSLWPFCTAAMGLAAAAMAGLFVGAVAAWVDPEGRIVLSDGEDPPSRGAVRVEPGELGERWKGSFLEPVQRRDTDSSTAENRLNREVRALLDELERGDRGTARAGLLRLYREHPTRPDVALALAHSERRRGRLESAEQIVATLLTTPAALQEPWETRARTALEELREELDVDSRLTGKAPVRRAVDTSYFRLTYDHRLAGRAFGEQVTQVLERVRLALLDSLGRSLERPLEVHLYTRPQYLDAHRHRFGFQTVGFYDGAIHVVTSRHPRTELLALLTHEYAHALFEDALGGHQPFLLNEGISEREEERVRGRGGLVRAEWWKLAQATRTEEWIPLGQLVIGFGELKSSGALLAYLESRAAVELIGSKHPGVIARWLRRCGEGEAWEQVLVDETGWDVAALDRALRADARSRFPEEALAAP